MYADGEVTDIDTDGCLILWDGDKKAAYNCGETIDEFGIENLTDKELQRIREKTQERLY